MGTNADDYFNEYLDKIEEGLAAFENLLAFFKGMANDVFDEVTKVYENEADHIYTDFIKLGLDFVKDHPNTQHVKFDLNTTADLSQVDSSQRDKQDESA